MCTSTGGGRCGRSNVELTWQFERRNAAEALQGVRDGASQRRDPSRGKYHGAQDMASPNFMELAILGLDIGILCDFIYSALLLSTMLGLDSLRPAQSRDVIPAQGLTDNENCTGLVQIVVRF
jgi:hypothetical protein